MTGPRWPIVFAGILTGTLIALGLEQLHLNAMHHVRDKLTVTESKLRDLGAVKVPFDAYEKDRARVEAQLKFIEQERARQRCPGLLLGALDLEGRATVDSVVLDGTTLALVGQADSPANVDALAAGLRGAARARTVRAGTARGSGRGLRFGILATVDPPACPAAESEAPSPPRVAGR
jgi:hypothetical protein